MFLSGSMFVSIMKYHRRFFTMSTAKKRDLNKKLVGCFCIAAIAANSAAAQVSVIAPVRASAAVSSTEEYTGVIDLSQLLNYKNGTTACPAGVTASYGKDGIGNDFTQVIELTILQDGTYKLIGSNYINNCYVDVKIIAAENRTVNIVCDDAFIKNDEGSSGYDSGAYSNSDQGKGYYNSYVVPFLAEKHAVINVSGKLYVDTYAVYDGTGGQNFLTPLLEEKHETGTSVLAWKHGGTVNCSSFNVFYDEYYDYQYEPGPGFYETDCNYVLSGYTYDMKKYIKGYDCLKASNGDASAVTGQNSIYLRSSHEFGNDTECDNCGYTCCTVTLNKNDGSEPVTVNVDSGEVFSEPTAPTRENCTFGGWYTDETFETPYDFTAPVTGNITLYAKWTDCAVESLSVKNLPEKTEYVEGESFDPAGLVLTVTYDSGETEDITYSKDNAADFTVTPSGALSESDTSVTVTYGGKSVIVNVTVKKGAVNVKPSDDNFGGAKIDMPMDDLIDAILDEEDKQLIEQGVDISVLMTSITIDPEYVPEEDKAAINTVLDDYTIGCYIDVSLFKRYSNGKADKPVTDPSSPITISFELPQYILDMYPDDEYEFALFCSHNGKGYEVESWYDPETNIMKFSSDKFSTYALGVKVADPVASFVDRLYKNLLGREADEHKADHIANLLSGKSASEVAFDFVFSPEFTDMDISNEERVRRMYLTFLNREPDPAGLATWTKALDDGNSIGHIFIGFTQSKEFAEICGKYSIEQGEFDIVDLPGENHELMSFIARFYSKALGRKYDIDGLNEHIGSYLADRDFYQLAFNFIFSPEYIEKNLSDEEFVENMYEVFFDRSSDPEGKADWVGRLKSGASREDVLAGFVGSQECAELMAGFGI